MSGKIGVSQAADAPGQFADAVRGVAGRLADHAPSHSESVSGFVRAG
jgi:hypothetical protein